MPTAPPEPLDVWIDTDPSIGLPGHDADDGFALVQAFHSPELRIRGVSTTYGNAAVGTTTRIAREMADRFGSAAGLRAKDVFPGAAREADLGKPTAASEALDAALTERPLTYLALAPLTNLATLLRLRPAAAERIARVIFVGGRTPGTRFRAGRWNPYEFTDGNFHKDHAAAAVVLASAGFALTLVPVELALTLPLRPRELERIGREGGPAGRYLHEKARWWMRLWRWCFAVEGAMVFDCLAVLAATHPHLLAGERRFAAFSHGERERASAHPRQVHLLARPGDGPEAGREVHFLREALPGAREALVARLLGRGHGPDPVQAGAA